MKTCLVGTYRFSEDLALKRVFAEVAPGSMTKAASWSRWISKNSNSSKIRAASSHVKARSATRGPFHDPSTSAKLTWFDG
ncbi:hypothetical protein E4K65_12980 [Bradyrhizobium niftali]|uniref:Uncharacterized protein n=1 Tax=Bradyrhizobium niftali TaxID=2560055 RepID=A0A4Y9LZW8_9BRAD|nr:hypothetical protein E4K65_12980 [Bradyrhizobium niftali]